MIITRTPFRISFVGGGSDLPSFYRQHPGAVLSVTIDKYMYISSHQFFEPDKIRVKYNRTETVADIGKLQHPIFREVFERFRISGGIEFSSIADVPAGTGMGSSSSFTVGLLHNIAAGRGEEISKQELAEGACHIEIDRLKEPIGRQDQFAAAYGGLNVIRFHSDDRVTVEAVEIGQAFKRELESSLMLFYTGLQRSAGEILSEQQSAIKEKDKFDALVEMTALTDDLKEALQAEQTDKIGHILHTNWVLKRKLTKKISNDAIDDAYRLAMKSGALGGKLLGAGGGGFLLFVCPRDRREQLAGKLGLRQVDFKFDSDGSKLIYSAD